MGGGAGGANSLSPVGIASIQIAFAAKLEGFMFPSFFECVSVTQPSHFLRTDHVRIDIFTLFIILYWT